MANKLTRHKEERRKLKLAKKEAKRRLYLSRIGQPKAEHARKPQDPNRYGKIWEQQRRAA